MMVEFGFDWVARRYYRLMNGGSPRFMADPDTDATVIDSSPTVVPPIGFRPVGQRMHPYAVTTVCLQSPFLQAAVVIGASGRR